MNRFILVLLSLLVAASVSHGALQKVPSYQVSFATGGVYYAISPTADTARAVFIELDSAQSNQSARISSNEVNVANNAASITNNASNISSNQAGIASLSNRVTAAESTNTARQATINSLTQTVDRVGSAWSMGRTTDITSGTKNIAHALTYETASAWGAGTTNSLDMSLGKFTPPWDGLYRAGGAFTAYRNPGTYINSWVVRLVKSGDSHGTQPFKEIVHQYTSDDGNIGGGNSYVLDLTTNDYIRILYMSNMNLSAASNFVASGIMQVEYLGE